MKRSPIITDDEATFLRTAARRSHKDAITLTDEMIDALRIMAKWTLDVYNDLYAKDPETVPSPPLMSDSTLHDLSNTGRMFLRGRGRIEAHAAAKNDSDIAQAWQFLREEGAYDT